MGKNNRFAKAKEEEELLQQCRDQYFGIATANGDIPEFLAEGTDLQVDHDPNMYLRPGRRSPLVSHLTARIDKLGASSRKPKLLLGRMYANIVAKQELEGYYGKAATASKRRNLK